MKHTWRSLNEVLSTLSESEILAMLTEERKGDKRIAMLQRLHQRYCALRDSRERIEILNEATQ